MKLLTSPTSPFARKIRILLRLKNLLGQVEEITALPAEKPAILLEASALGKVPVLILDNGQTLPESAAICLWLDEVDGQPTLHGTGQNRLLNLRWQAFADGLMAHGVDVVMGRRRNAGQADSDWFTARLASIGVTLDRLESQASELIDAPVGMGSIGMVCALDFLSFRLPELDLAKRWPRLLAHVAKLNATPAFADTKPN